MQKPTSQRSLNPVKGVFWTLLAVAAFAAGLWAFHGRTTGSAEVAASKATQPAATAENPQPASAAPESAPAAAPEQAGQTSATAAATVAAGQPVAPDAPEATEQPGGATRSDGTAAPPNPAQLKVGLYPPDVVKDAKATLCYFSFNTPTEFYRARIMASAMNKYSPIQFTVKELVTNGADIEDAVAATLNSGLKCDGVVLSGHHTDEYYGDRSSGSIDIEDFEQLSYNPKYSAWFAHVKALWLEGCNTGKFRVLAKPDDVDSDERINGSPLAKMTALMDLSDISGSIDDMTDLLKDNLNEDNLVSGYLRIFPNATAFSWTNSAPGIKAGSDHSLPFHIAQLSHILNPDDSIYANPMPAHLAPEVAMHYSAALYGMLMRGTGVNTAVPGMTEKNFIEAWSRHGNYRYKWAFDNPSLRGFVNLMDESNELERQLRGLRSAQVAIDKGWIHDDDSVMQVADWLLEHQTITPFASYTLQAMLTKARSHNKKLYARLLTAMRKNPALQHELEQASQADGYRASDARRMLSEIEPAGQPDKSRAAVTHTNVAGNGAP